MEDCVIGFILQLHCAECVQFFINIQHPLEPMRLYSALRAANYPVVLSFQGCFLGQRALYQCFPCLRQLPCKANENLLTQSTLILGHHLLAFAPFGICS